MNIQAIQEEIRKVEARLSERDKECLAELKARPGSTYATPESIEHFVKDQCGPDWPESEIAVEYVDTALSD